MNNDERLEDLIKSVPRGYEDFVKYLPKIARLEGVEDQIAHFIRLHPEADSGEVLGYFESITEPFDGVEGK